MAPQYEALLKEIQRIAVEEGGIVSRAFHDPASIDFIMKGDDVHNDTEPVTALDLHVEDAFHTQLKKKFPELGFYLEERPENNDDSKELTCYIDPIDGTKYFSKNIPMFSMMVGIMRGDEPVLGVVYNPLTKQLYAGAEGIPTTMNGKPVSVSTTETLEAAIISLDMSSHKEHWEEEKNWMNKKITELNTQAKRIRLWGLGGLSLAWVATGGIDAYVDMWGHKGKIFDIVAGKALVKYAAGGTVIDLEVPGIAEPRCVAGNKKLVEKIREVLMS